MATAPRVKKRVYKAPAFLKTGIERTTLAMFGLSENEKRNLKIKPHIALNLLADKATVAELALLQLRFEMGLELAGLFDQSNIIDPVIGECTCYIAELAEAAEAAGTRNIRIASPGLLSLMRLALNMTDALQDNCLRREISSALVRAGRNIESFNLFGRSDRVRLGMTS